MSRQSTPSTIATIGIDPGKNTFHVVGLDHRGQLFFVEHSRKCLSRASPNSAQERLLSAKLYRRCRH